MTKKKSTKRALISSLLILAMCFTMLAGTTFAWFTDSVSSGSNIIKSGKLDVDLLVKGGNIDTATYGTDYVSLDANPGLAIFNYDLWEPGYTVVANAKVVNKGNLALKYTLKIAATGTASELADVIDVYYAPSEVTVADRNLAGLTKLGTLAEVLAGGANVTINDYLLAGDAPDFATIALQMQTTAGNEYQEKSIGSGFTLQLLATQYTYEEDSFDEQYDAAASALSTWDGTAATTAWYDDADATATEYTISTAADLAGLAQLVNDGTDFTGKTVKLSTNIDLSGKTWTPIGNAPRGTTTAFKGTFDGGNNTIFGLTNAGLTPAANADGEYVFGLFGNVDNAVIKNVKLAGVNIVDIEGKTGDSVGALVGYYANADDTNGANISDVSVSANIVEDGESVGGVVGRVYGTAFKAENITVSGSVSSYYRAAGVIGYTNVKTLTLNNCANSAAVSSTGTDDAHSPKNYAYHLAAGLAVAWSNNGANTATVNLTGCTNSGSITSAGAGITGLNSYPASFTAPLVYVFSPNTIY